MSSTSQPVVYLSNVIGSCRESNLPRSFGNQRGILLDHQGRSSTLFGGGKSRKKDLAVLCLQVAGTNVSRSEMARVSKRPANEHLTGLFTGPLTAQFYLVLLTGPLTNR